MGFYLIDPEGSNQRDEMIFHWFTYHGSSRCQTLRWLICSFDSNVYFYLHCLMMFWYADDKNISGYMFLFWYFNWLLFSKWDCTFSLNIKWIIHTSWKPNVINVDDIIGKWFRCLLSLSTIIYRWYYLFHINVLKADWGRTVWNYVESKTILKTKTFCITSRIHIL